MTRDEARKAAKVLLAFADGASIQSKERGDSDDWWEDNLEPRFQFLTNNYRIKPEPKTIWLAEDGSIFTEEKHAQDYQEHYKIKCKKYVEVVE